MAYWGVEATEMVVAAIWVRQVMGGAETGSAGMARIWVEAVMGMPEVAKVLEMLMQGTGQPLEAKQVLEVGMAAREAKEAGKKRQPTESSAAATAAAAAVLGTLMLELAKSLLLS